MNALLIFLGLVAVVTLFVSLFMRGRKKAIAELRGYVTQFTDPNANIDVVHSYDHGIGLCSQYELSGQEFGLGNLEAFYKEASAALSRNRRAITPGDTVALQRNDADFEKLRERHHTWEQWRSQKIEQLQLQQGAECMNS